VSPIASFRTARQIGLRDGIVVRAGAIRYVALTPSSLEYFSRHISFRLASWAIAARDDGRVGKPVTHAAARRRYRPCIPSGESRDSPGKVDRPMAAGTSSPPLPERHLAHETDGPPADLLGPL